VDAAIDELYDEDKASLLELLQTRGPGPWSPGSAATRWRRSPSTN
jgi:hypothetical protein